jgi:tripartite-type tricarboxylate transporter receptor subunit TctC
MARLASSIVAVILCALSSAAVAQEPFPSKPVRVIVPTGAGGSNDFVFHVLSEKFALRTGQPIVIENRAGASGMIAAEAVAKASPDGYTLLMAIPTIMSINPHVFSTAPYDAEKSFIPVTHLLTTNYFFLASSSFAAKSIPELISTAKANPGKISFGSAGHGSTSHFLMAMLGHSAAIEFLHVPYKGASLALTDLMTGQINTSVSAIESAREQVKSGRIRVLAVASPKRAATMPDVPTFAELGYPDVIATLWMGLVAPAGTPRPRVEKLQTEIAQALQYPDLRQRLGAADQELVGSTPEQFAELLRADRARWGKAVKASGFKASN